MALDMDWLERTNQAAIKRAAANEKLRRQKENNIDYQCEQDTVDGDICRFIKKYAEAQTPPLDVAYEWNGVTRWFTVGDQTVSMSVGRWLSGGARLVVQKSELEIPWWRDALFNNPEFKLYRHELDIRDEEEEKKKRDEAIKREEWQEQQQDKKMLKQIKQEVLDEGPQEIERKFLVKNLPPNLEQYESVDISQGYVSIKEDGTELRVRKQGDTFLKTQKSGGGKVRTENESEITQEEFLELWQKTTGKRLGKKRYKIPYEGKIVELDIYQGELSGTIVAEVEFETEEESERFTPPYWFDEEVTENQRYKNKNLVTLIAGRNK